MNFNLRSRTICGLLFGVISFSALAPAHAIERAKPESVGLDSKVLNGLYADLVRAQQRKYARDFSVAVVKNGKLVYSRSVGYARENTLFDVASLTKPIATATAVMKLAEEGRLRLDEPVVTYLPTFASCRFAWEILSGRPARHTPSLPAQPSAADYEPRLPIVSIMDPKDLISFALPPPPQNPTLEQLAFELPKPEFWNQSNDAGEVPADWMTHYCDPKKKITLEMLLRHRSGLRDLVLGRYVDDAIKQKLDPYQLFAEVPLRGTPRYDYVYADINFVLLRMVIDSVLAQEKITAESWIVNHIFKPLGMKDSTFKPTVEQSKRLLRSVAPTLANAPKFGQIHDPLSRALGGYGGNAGLFTTALDLAEFASKMGTDAFPLKPETVGLIRQGDTWLDTGECIDGAKRALGWDIDSPLTESAKGKFTNGVGHTGYTGASIWIDHELDVSVILLSNRLYYRGAAGERTSRKAITALRRTVAERVLKSFVTPPASQN